MAMAPAPQPMSLRTGVKALTKMRWKAYSLMPPNRPAAAPKIAARTTTEMIWATASIRVPRGRCGPGIPFCAALDWSIALFKRKTKMRGTDSPCEGTAAERPSAPRRCATKPGISWVTSGAQLADLGVRHAAVVLFLLEWTSRMRARSSPNGAPGRNVVQAVIPVIRALIGSIATSSPYS